ncbi:MAG: hypothetical protein QXD85_03730 [Fervidicoccaceae archaeon]
MIPGLMYRDKTFEKNLQFDSENLVIDLGLDIIIKIMGGGDEFIESISKKVLLSGGEDEETVIYRQKVLQDAISNYETVLEMYKIVSETIEKIRSRFFITAVQRPSYVLHESITILNFFLEAIERMKRAISLKEGNFSSDGFKSFFHILLEEFNQDYINELRTHLRNLEFEDGVNLRGEILGGNRLGNFVLLVPREKSRLSFLHIFEREYSFTLAPMDEAGGQILEEMIDSAVANVASIIKDAADKALKFLHNAKTELAFYIGCVNLYRKLKSMGEPLTFPKISKTFRFKGLYDIALSISNNGRTVKNSLYIDKQLIIITGPNSGGKSTFLRSLGQAQLMLGVGMFVPAEEYEGPLFREIHTHFRREESTKIDVGKLENELVNIKNIVEKMNPNSFFLFNEPFSSTNEVEGSELAKQLIDSLLEGGVVVGIVTHFYMLAEKYMREPELAAFLIAERKEDGTRTFRIIPGKPSYTSFARELFERIFMHN